MDKNQVPVFLTHEVVVVVAAAAAAAVTVVVRTGLRHRPTRPWPRAPRF